jgi:hypothetical protein
MAGEVVCNIDREGISEPPLEEGDRYFDGFGCRDDLGDQGICLSLGIIRDRQTERVRDDRAESDLYSVRCCMGGRDRGNVKFR